MLTRQAAAVMLTTSTLLTMAPVARAGSEQQCAQGRYAAAAKYAQCHNKALAKLFATNDLVKLQRALSKCRVKYSGTWPRLQAQALGSGSTCDADRFVATTIPFGPGDMAVVIDNLTGLQWEQKTDDGGFHDKDDVYSWYQAYADFVAPFSDTAYARHDWRLPTVAELQTLLSQPFPCATSPCVDGAVGLTVAGDYWSATTLADNPDYAWGVYFGNANVSAVSYGIKTINNSVRMVRGGL
jgi:hypothetical protein